MRTQQKRQYSGGMSDGAKKRLARAITVMSQAIKPGWVTNPATGKMFYHQFSFITLTVSSPKNITARQGYDLLLAPMLDWLRKTKNVKTYIWKAELQKRGQLHYHITSPALIHYKEIRDKWNYLQREAGLLDEYAQEHGHYDAPSTDIAETRQVRNIDRYLIKELSKSLSAIQVAAIKEAREKVKAGGLTAQEAQEEIQRIAAEKIRTVGKIWDCSTDLSGVNYFATYLTQNHESMIDCWIEQGVARKKIGDFHYIIYCDNVDPPDLLNLKEFTSFNNYLSRIIDNNPEQIEFVPAECVQPELVNIEQSYTWEQLKIALN